MPVAAPESTPPPNHGKTIGHSRELDGIRALAIKMVLIGHLFDTPSFTAARGPLHAVFFFVHHGYLGVDLFFVLSGFLITSILLRTRHLGTKEFFKRFYTRRALRILPLYGVVLIAITVVAGAPALPWFGFAALMSANLSWLFGVDFPPSGGPFWSLAVEEQFYLVWPWLVLALPTRVLATVAVGLLVLEPGLRLAFRPSGFETILTWFHCDGLAMGAFVAIWLANWNGSRRSAGLFAGLLTAAFVIEFFAFEPLGGWHAGSVAIATRFSEATLLFGALVVVSIAFANAAWLAPLRWHFAARVARYSYCIYLVHRPLMDTYWVGVNRFFPSLAHVAGIEALVWRACFVVPAAFAIAAFSWRYFEEPLLRLGKSEAAIVPGLELRRAGAVPPP